MIAFLERLLDRGTGTKRLTLVKEIFDLQAELATLHTEKTLLQDRLESALSDRARVWDELRVALAQERIAYQSQINIECQRHYGIAPFPDAPHLPPSRVVDPPEPGPISQRMTPSQAVHAKTEEFIKDFTTRLKTAYRPTKP